MAIGPKKQRVKIDGYPPTPSLCHYSFMNTTNSCSCAALQQCVSGGVWCVTLERDIAVTPLLPTDSLARVAGPAHFQLQTVVTSLITGY
ncbi:hypothetical protein L484_015074 [Morus notabilis]|uniref:Uncharacterized protein n=1 Tax=Morus notabilis TaxID=981085 RepID=W9SFA3_9ROSA|nr:hypothetical protein L484_015074 [Morus notabilis]